MATNENIVVYGSTYHRTNNDNEQGGDIDLSKKILTTNMTALDYVTLVSSSNDDVSQSYLIEGIAPYNLKITETMRLDGVDSVSTSKVFAQISRISKVSGTYLTGTVTVSHSGGTIGTITPGIIGSEGLVVTGADSTEILELIQVMSEVPSNPTYEKTIYLCLCDF